jgi:hypothetical protein
MGWRFASMKDREAVVGMVIDAAKEESLRLTPPMLAISPEVVRRADGSSVFRSRHSVVIASAELAGSRGPALGSLRGPHCPRPSAGMPIIGSPDNTTS